MNQEGISLDVEKYWGQVARNVAEGNQVAGIDIVLREQNGVPATFQGRVVDNQLNRNRTTSNESGTTTIGGYGLRFKPVGQATFNGMINDNVVSRNRRVGMDVALTEFNGQVAGNEVKEKTGLGLDLRINLTAGLSAVDVRKNLFSGNAGGDKTDVRIENEDAGTLDLTLKRNRSLNSDPDLVDPTIPPYNFDLLNSGSGAFNVSPANVNDVNVGSVGSP